MLGFQMRAWSHNTADYVHYFHKVTNVYKCHDDSDSNTLFWQILNKSDMSHAETNHIVSLFYFTSLCLCDLISFLKIN